MELKVLGPLEIRIGDTVCTPSAAKIRQVLALITLRANQIVSLRSLIEELWGEHPPRSAVTTVQTYIYQLRKTIAKHTDNATAEAAIRTVPPGYQFSVDPDHLDLARFDRHVEQGQRHLDQRQFVLAAESFSHALRVWSGPPLADVHCGTLLGGYETHLRERRLTAIELRVHTAMQLGAHRELIAELTSLVREYPFNEWLLAQLMLALERSGRRGEALLAYQNGRHVLSEELGLDPSFRLQQIHLDLLRGDEVTIGEPVLGVAGALQPREWALR
jgi:SARP family transcriptional regulator, regulator of embCAB operon